MPVTTVHVDARPVALARILVGLATLVCLLEVIVILSQVGNGKLAYPWVEALPPVSSGLVAWLGVIGAVATVSLVIGIQPRSAAIVAFGVLVFAQFLDQQTYSNHLVLCTLLLLYLSFAQSGGQWSLDALLGRRRRTVPWWPQLLMMALVSTCYLFAGLSKINPRFLSGDTLPEAMWLQAPNPVFRALAVVVICTELFIALGLWHRTIRPLAVLAGFGLHAGILVGMASGWLTFLAFALLCFSTYWMFLARPTLRWQDGTLIVPKGDMLAESSAERSMQGRRA